MVPAWYYQGESSTLKWKKKPYSRWVTKHSVLIQIDLFDDHFDQLGSLSNVQWMEPLFLMKRTSFDLVDFEIVPIALSIVQESRSGLFWEWTFSNYHLPKDPRAFSSFFADFRYPKRTSSRLQTGSFCCLMPSPNAFNQIDRLRFRAIIKSQFDFWVTIFGYEEGWSLSGSQCPIDFTDSIDHLRFCNRPQNC